MKYLLKIVFWLLTLIPAFLTATTPIRTLAQQQQQQQQKSWKTFVLRVWRVWFPVIVPCVTLTDNKCADLDSCCCSACKNHPVAATCGSE